LNCHCPPTRSHTHTFAGLNVAKIKTQFYSGILPSIKHTHTVVTNQGYSTTEWKRLPVASLDHKLKNTSVLQNYFDLKHKKTHIFVIEQKN
jgi:hypothetical protein